MNGKEVTHLVWIPAAATVGFVPPFLVSDLLALPRDLYYLIYFGVVLGFFGVYVRVTDLDLRAWLTRRLGRGIVLGALGGLVLMQGVLARPETAYLDGWTLGWALLWRGVIYGTVDGLLLLAFPWLVAWRAFGAEERTWGARIGASCVAIASIFLITTTYHLGYSDFRSRMIVQPNIGSAIGSVPTLVTANPVASPLSHVFLHVTAVIHSPETNLFLPPHRE